MTTQVENAVVHFPEWYDERGEWEAESKGWLPGVRVDLPTGLSYPLFFYDPVRLTQDLQSDASHDVIAEPGLVVIPEVTRTNIIRAIEKLVGNGYFDRLKPLRLPIANGSGH